ncbi:branched-chain amino acid ABC transporter permease [Diplocloster modestus]|uniref:Branched-chain amino acid ABC transporter permease n=1 Tax=Diplocloster modestus TaxID=2850322 RepID=A0ABS6KAY5_9FIRM|nr:branched-chain amino acid ABC transporter permease [Diplocloster modestus]MBU9727667.1 branched-chain amino acid ABC transporter permease [Diplocloster modestus]
MKIPLLRIGGSEKKEGITIQHKAEKIALLLTICIVIVFPILFPNDYLIHIGCMIGINIIVALGMYVVTGASGQINMGQYGFFCVGSYTAALVTTRLGLDFWFCVLITCLVCSAAGLCVGFLALRIEGPYLALCTLAFGESVRLIINNASWAGRATGIMRIGKLSVFGFDMTTKSQCYFFIMILALITLVIVNNLMHSRQGRRFKAIKDDAIASSVMGINVTKSKMFAFCVSGILGGLGGCVYACYVNYVNPTTYVQGLQVKFLLMIVLGGLGSQWGALVGAIMVTVFYELTRTYGQYQSLAAGLIMIFIILVLRRGVVGTVVHRYQQRIIRKTHLLEKRRLESEAHTTGGDSE